MQEDEQKVRVLEESIARWAVWSGPEDTWEPPHRGRACVSLRVTPRPTSVAVDTEAASGFLLWESWRKGGTTTNLPEGFLAPAQLALQP